MMKISTKNLGILALLAVLVIGVVLMSGCVKVLSGDCGIQENVIKKCRIT